MQPPFPILSHFTGFLASMAMVHERVQQRVEGAAEHDMTGAAATLPNELLLWALEHVMLRWDRVKQWRGAVRGVSQRWRALHNGAYTRLRLLEGITGAPIHAL
jgi:hypothetical protein